MAWKNISGYLEKFFTIVPPKKFYQKEIVRIINNIVNINLSQDDVDYMFGIVYVKSNNQILKNEIFFNKEKIIKALSSEIKNNKTKDIRFTGLDK